MKREFRQVAYSFEYGDETLPHLKDLATDIEDPEKDKIIKYLGTNCVLTCPGIIRDVINPDNSIGFGDVFTDGTYYWQDAFVNYVSKYNIPVPDEFRTHILNNYSARMSRHELLQSIDSVEFHNTPYPGCEYNVRIYRKGVVKYHNNTDCKDGVEMTIDAEDAGYIIDPIMRKFFCYDSDEHGKAVEDGYHWKLTYYKKDEVIETVEGWPGEDLWRYRTMKSNAEFVERYVPQNLGSEDMKYYELF